MRGTCSSFSGSGVRLSGRGERLHREKYWREIVWSGLSETVAGFRAPPERPRGRGVRQPSGAFPRCQSARGLAHSMTLPRYSITPLSYDGYSYYETALAGSDADQDAVAAGLIWNAARVTPTWRKYFRQTAGDGCCATRDAAWMNFQSVRRCARARGCRQRRGKRRRPYHRRC